MIQPNELRKGNKVLYNGNIQTVVGYCSEYVYLDCITADYVTFEEIFPIEITYDVLIKKEFKQTSCGFLFIATEKEYINLEIDLQRKFIILYDGFTPFEMVYTEYLHQLQNLYYSITNKEL